MIEIQNLTKSYGQIKAVDDISFTVEKGEVLGFLGPNGAGKSTTMNIITGFIPSTEGTVKVCGYDIMENPEEVKRKIGFLPELPPLYMDMTTYEYLNFVADLKLVGKNQKKGQISDVMELVKLVDVRGRLIKNLSKGYKQRVGLAQSLLGAPEVLILDEPTVGLDPMQIIEIRKLIKALGKQHTIILSSHILPEVSAVCERVVIINKGKIAAIDTPENLSKGMGSVSKLSATIAGPKSSIVSSIEEIYGIKYVEPHIEKDSDVIEYIIESDKETDIRRPLFFAMAKAGYPIIELKSLDLSLEEIFLQLTTQEKEVM
ncbi:ABC-2 type transport system ATP-binding protein [Ruminiclostridium sufflavum DSM 19573]|uniref:ABC-2 type transport system ATP-binding protein n=1 Tax=Ruminiclostridium sufflavum DSM 19573 TaxID=1121337 RepID=A0A318XS93_9FIRM|nr:ABC transporter ATP-binding protein [Ruminiclostridium sufflavum]PYG89444.1 ABC-2 type transport system ATP-binding protein [Ruminiclostridium sufflavum DSM 19573]